MRMIEKTDGEGKTILVEDPDWITEDEYFRKHRKKITNFTPKRKRKK